MSFLLLARFFANEKQKIAGQNTKKRKMYIDATTETIVIEQSLHNIL